MLILVTKLQFSKLMEWFKILKNEYVKNRTELFHEIKQINSASILEYLDPDEPKQLLLLLLLLLLLS